LRKRNDPHPTAQDNQVEDETGNEYQRISQEHIEIMDDYSLHLIKIKQLRNDAHAALSDKKWEEARDLIDKIAEEAKMISMYCTRRLT
jgi:hypothetical protein